MGRKTQLPQARKIKKQDVGPAAFFKHRKQAQQQQEEATSASTSSEQSASSKGKTRHVAATHSLSDTTPVQDLMSSMISSSTSIVEEIEANAASSSSLPLPFSPYSHLTHSNVHGTNKDSSLRAYAHHLQSLVSQSDVLIQVLDARDPMGSRSFHTEKLLTAHPEKKLLLILTKIDLVPKQVLQKWLLYLRQYYPTLAFKSTSTLSSSGRASRKIQTTVSASSSSLEASSSATLLQLLKNYARSQPKGMSLTVGIYGPPNVGKSSLINSLVKSRACSVAPRPGETKHLQTVLLDRKVRLIDSPGVAMSSARGLEDGIEDVLRGTVKIELVEDPAKPVEEILRRSDPVKVTKLYKLPSLLREEDQLGDMHGDPAQGSTTINNNSVKPSVIHTDDDHTGPTAARAPVDFASIRQGRADGHEDEEDASDRDEDGDDFHRGTFDEDVEAPVPNVKEHSLSASIPTSTNGSTCVIGFDPLDVTDFLLRLAFTKGKMLRGGKPDLDGAARMVINDWNLGRIAWYKPPPESKIVDKGPDTASMTSRPAVTNAGGQEKDEEMRSAPSVATRENNEVMAGFSDAFDLQGLFAQADAQLFGGKVHGAQDHTSSTTLTTQESAVRTDRILTAADVTSSSLGKRNRGNEAEDDDWIDEVEHVSSSEGDEDESDAGEGDGGKRLRGFASSFDRLDCKKQDVDEAMSTTPAASSRAANGNGTGRGKGRGKADRETDVLSILAGTKADKSKPRIPAHILLQQQQYGVANSDVSSSIASQGISNAPRGQRSSSSSKKIKPAHKTAPPAYLERLEHKASLPTNIKKIRREGLEDMELSGGGKKGGERKRLRKMQRRENAREAGGVWKELEEVTLD